MDDEKKENLIIDMIGKQAAVQGDITRVLHDVNNIANTQREDARAINNRLDVIESRLDKLDMEIWKKISLTIGVVVSVVVWFIDKFGLISKLL